MYEIDEITYAGNSAEPICVTSVYASNDYKLFLEFMTGEQRIFDASELIKEDNIFQQLCDISLFLQAHIDYDTVVWNDMIDIAPEFLYENSIGVEPKR